MIASISFSFPPSMAGPMKGFLCGQLKGILKELGTKIKYTYSQVRKKIRGESQEQEANQNNQQNA